MLAFAAGTANCKFVYRAHSEVCFAWGIAPDTLKSLVADQTFLAVEPRFRPLFAFIRKLTLSPTEMKQADADAILDAGWSEKTFHDVVARIVARMSFMQSSSKVSVSSRFRSNTPKTMPQSASSLAMSTSTRCFAPERNKRHRLNCCA